MRNNPPSPSHPLKTGGLFAPHLLQFLHIEVEILQFNDFAAPDFECGYSGVLQRLPGFVGSTSVKSYGDGVGESQRKDVLDVCLPGLTVLLDELIELLVEELLNGRLSLSGAADRHLARVDNHGVVCIVGNDLVFASVVQVIHGAT